MRAANMQALTNDLKNRYPGIVVYGIGDEAHQHSASDHNEDDTSGSNSAQTDSDNIPEHRAIDAMLGSVFTHAEADALVAKMVVDAPSQARLYYIIWNRYIWSRSNNWVIKNYTGSNPHTDHVHYSGWAADDENAAGWPVVYASSGSGPTPPRLRRSWPSYMKSGNYFGHIDGPNESHGGYYTSEQPDVKAIQDRLNSIGFSCGKADGIFGNNTKSGVSSWQSKLYPQYTSRYGEVWSDDWQRLFTY